MGSVRPVPVERSETHSLALTRSGLRMGGIGIDRITKVYSWMGPSRRGWKGFPDFLSMPFDAHFGLAYVTAGAERYGRGCQDSSLIYILMDS